MGVARSRSSKRSRKSVAPAGGGGNAPAPTAATARGATVAASSSSSVNGDTLTFTFPSDLGASREVHRAVMDRVEAMKYDEQSTFAIRLALEEGIMNAMKHGNKMDAGKTVHVEVKVTPRSTQIIIEDQGKGFDRTDVPDPCAAENLLKCSGRGLLLMEAYMDKVQYTRGGRRVKMIKKNS
jgi:serine/threonine-protein kinase RsbW